MSPSHERGTLDANARIGAPTATPDCGAQERVDESAIPVAPARLLVTVEEAARILAIGRSLMYQLVSSEEVDSVKIGRARRIAVAALEEYVMRQRTGSPYAWERPSRGCVNRPGKEGDNER
jgi:excisionase family DNA binding protein